MLVSAVVLYVNSASLIFGALCANVFRAMILRVLVW